MKPWLLYALLSAVAAGFVPIFAKIGMSEVDPNLATAVRSIVMTLFLAGVCQFTGAWSKVQSLHGRAILLIVLSGIAGAISWLFYFRAVHVGEVSQVAPIDKLSMPLGIVLAVLILRDRPTLVNWIGVLLIVGGGYLAAMPRAH
jgi:transporter family protein